MPVPDRIGRFAVRERLGGGAFASVWLAHDDVLDSAVAIKVLSENWLDSAEVRRRFLAEARLLRIADSDRVVRVHDVGELDDGRPYLVMTFADRGTMADRLAAGPLPWREAVALAVEVSMAVQVLHDNGVLHRDIKPSNVLFRSRPDGSDQVLLGDLGLGKLLSDASALTFAGGTPAYMAPEQARPGAPVSVRTDVYGLGALLYRALTGRHPNDLVEFAAIADPARPAPAAPSSIVAEVPAELDAVVRRAMRPDPDQRHADAAEFRAELEALADRTLAAPASVPKRTRPRRRWLAVAGVALLVGAAAGATWFAYLPAEVEASDSTRMLRLQVPRGWAAELTGQAWDPGLLGLPAGREPALVVAVSVSAYASADDARPGVFAGVLPAAPAMTAEVFGQRVARPGCTAIAAAGGDSPRVRTATRQRCAAIVVDDALLEVSGRQVWVQVKQPADDPDATRAVLSSVAVSAS